LLILYFASNTQFEYFARIIFVIRALLLLPLTTAEPTINCNCTCVSHRTHAIAGPWSWFCSRETLISTPSLWRHSGVILTRWQRLQQIKDRVSFVIRAVRKHVFSSFILLSKNCESCAFVAKSAIVIPIIYTTNSSEKNGKISLTQLRIMT